MKRLQLAGITLLLLFLTSCGVLGQTPPDQAVRLAIAQQQTNIRQNIAQGLGISSQSKPNLSFKIDRLNIQKRQKLPLQSQAAYPPDVYPPDLYPKDIYKVRGTFDTTLTTSNQTVHQQSPFEVYLGTNPRPERDKNTPEPETWYLIPPDSLKPPQ